MYRPGQTRTGKTHKEDEHEDGKSNDALALDYLNHTKENIDWLKGLYGKDDLTDSHDPGYVPMSPEDTEVNHTLAITIHPTQENGGLANSWAA